MGLLDALMDLKGGLLARKERAYEAGLRAGEVEDAKALLGRYGAETAGQLGPGLLSSASPAQRQASLMLLADLAGRQTKGQQLDQALLEAQKPLPPLQAAQLQGQTLANVRQGQEISAFDAEQAREQARTAAYVDNLSFDNAVKMSSARRETLRFGLENEQKLRDNFTGDPVVRKAQQAFTALDQMDRALALNNWQALQSAIVAAVQIQEPGLAVRNDDRIAYTGNNSIAEQLVGLYNKSMSGGDVPPGMTERIRALGLQLAKPHQIAFRNVQKDYRSIAENTPGTRADEILKGTGIDEDILLLLEGLP